jgi:hypothetical protein
LIVQWTDRDFRSLGKRPPERPRRKFFFVERVDKPTDNKNLAVLCHRD